MREILFRGRDTAHNWHYGVPLFFTDDYVCIAKPHTYNKMVVPETIGQYTGLTDKNGKKIFEDDIVKVTDDNGETNLCSCGIGDVCFYDGSWYIGGEVNDGLYDVKNIYYIEVIGNIHDNPESVKEREG